MSFFTDNVTYDRTVADPESGEEATVTFRVLNAGDQSDLADTMRMEVGEDASVDIKLGQYQLLMLERAIVSWTLPVSPTADTIRQLQPEVFTKLVEYASFGKVPPLDSPLENTEDASLTTNSPNSN